MKPSKEGDAVDGKGTRKIKGGLLVDIGVPVFLPASQVDIRRPGEIGDLHRPDDRARASSRSTKSAATSSSPAAR